MILAHLPAGYILSRGFGIRRGPLLAVALVGSILPDFDMLWFHFIDNGQIHHHRYWVHVPGFWLMIAAIALPIIRLAAPQAMRAAVIGLTVILLHLVLDTVNGGIMWAWPFSSHLYSLITVPATQSHWVLSFLLHWSMAAELAIIATAIGLWFTRHKGTP